jgi:serine protease Do
LIFFSLISNINAQICQVEMFKSEKEQCWGTGSIVEMKDGTAKILTNYHVVKNPGNCNLYFWDGSPSMMGKRIKLQAKLLSADKKHDLAVVETDSTKLVGFPVLELSDCHVLVGEKLSAFGLRTGRSDGTVMRFLTPGAKNDLGEKDSWFVLSNCESNHGDSGGPVLDKDGRLIGVRWGMQNLGEPVGATCVTVDIVRSFLSAKDWKWRSSLKTGL